MSENMLPFGGTAVTDRPVQAEPELDDNVAGDNRKKLLYALVGVGVLVLAVVAFFLLKSGGSSSPAATGAVVPGHPVAGAAPAAAPAAAAPVTLPRKVKAPEGRDPFNALVTAAAPAASTAPSSSTATTPTTAPTSTTTGTGSTSTTTTHPATFHPVWVQLRSVTATTATFDVGFSNGKTMQVLAYRSVRAPKAGGETIFAKTFALLGVNKGVVTVKYGDGTAFRLDMTHNYMVVS